tara:strand:+ start:1430 stop:2155 length:726 start_codon:yes stop_codon:yes gene_type:complete
MLLIPTELSDKSPYSLATLQSKSQSLEAEPERSDEDNRMALSEYLLKGKSESHLNLDPKFSPALLKFLKASKDAGHDIDIYSGYRTLDHQKRLFEDAVKKYGSPEAARKWVAPPGKSKHNYGLAADLKYGTDKAQEWAHKNAEKYGLHFRMGHEPWQIELMETKSDKPNETNEKASEVMDEKTKEEQKESPFSSYMMKDIPYVDTRITLVQSDTPSDVAGVVEDVMTDEWTNKSFAKMLGL